MRMVIVLIGLTVGVLISPAYAGVDNIQVTSRLLGPELPGYTSHEFRIDFTGQLTGFQVYAPLETGSFYHDPNWSGPVPNNGFGDAIRSLFPTAAYDTFLTFGFPAESGTNVAGGAVNLGGASAPTDGQQLIDLAVYVSPGTVISDRQDFLVAQLTVTDDAAGDMLFLASAGDELSEIVSIDLHELNVAAAPEPGAAMLLVAGVPLLVRRLTRAPAC